MAETVTFDGSPPENCIHFGVGQPSADLLPVKLLARASTAFFDQAQPQELNYGECQGDGRFRATLAGFLGSAYGFDVSSAGLFVTAGNSQALDFVCERFTQPGDVVLVEEPSYFLAFQIFRDHGLTIVGVPTDGQGMCLDALQERVEQFNPALVYTIPSFHNPTGVSLSLKRREKMAQLSHEMGFIVVADEVYQLLYTDQPPPPPMAAWCQDGRILSLGSFSKILAPGLRLGWIQASDELMERLLSSGYVNSGGSVNHVISHCVRQTMKHGWLEAFIHSLRCAYRDRLQTMHQQLNLHLVDRLRWVRPGGGYFFWCEMRDGRDTSSLRERAIAAGTGFQAGRLFSSSQSFTQYLRLSFAHYDCEDIEEGIARLAAVIKS